MEPATLRTPPAGCTAAMADCRPWSPAGEERQPGLAQPAANPAVTANAVTAKLGFWEP
ncbi:hypothetical protein TIFTF001_002245 [Ficus carica]|uniref:Uncharacterized protein n=1 Tax=Ficus carica TaxID=3494 RepID=A0AA87ZSV3_FICCA|nr:hypothetical protein TIFTF001_002245 [Ficus carica]